MISIRRRKEKLLALNMNPSLGRHVKISRTCTCRELQVKTSAARAGSFFGLRTRRWVHMAAIMRTRAARDEGNKVV